MTIARLVFCMVCCVVEFCYCCFSWSLSVYLVIVSVSIAIVIDMVSVIVIAMAIVIVIIVLSSFCFVTVIAQRCRSHHCHSRYCDHLCPLLLWLSLFLGMVVICLLLVTITVVTTMVIIAAFVQKPTIMTNCWLTDHQQTNKRETVVC